MMGFSGQLFIIIIIIPACVLGVINFQNIIEFIVLPIICDGIPMYSMLLDIDLDKRDIMQIFRAIVIQFPNGESSHFSGLYALRMISLNLS